MFKIESGIVVFEIRLFCTSISSKSEPTMWSVKKFGSLDIPGSVTTLSSALGRQLLKNLPYKKESSSGKNWVGDHKHLNRSLLDGGGADTRIEAGNTTHSKEEWGGRMIGSAEGTHKKEDSQVLEIKSSNFWNLFFFFKKILNSEIQIKE